MYLRKYLYFQLIILCQFFISPIINAQNIEVQNVKFEQIQDRIVISYDLIGKVDKKHQIDLTLSDDFGASYHIEPISITGDVGKNILPGKNKKITWHLNRDFPEGLEGDGFVFAVEAELQKRKKWPWYMIGAGALGGAAYFVVQGLGDDEKTPTTGSVLIEVPNEI